MSLPREGRLAGIDYGTVRVGISISDPRQSLSSPLENYTRRDKTADAARFRRLAEEERIVGWVVGLPVYASGDESAKSREARAYGEWLAEVTGLPVAYYDERYTSYEAEQWLGMAKMTSKQRKARRDMLAAQILLANYLESPRDECDVAPGALEG